MQPAIYLVPIIAIAVTLLIRAELLNKRRHVYVIKPTATLLVIAVALLSLREPVWNPTYTWGVLIGLVFSLGGDVALMLKENPKAFKIGLGLFLLAHVAYTVVFTILGRFSTWDALSIPFLAAAGIGFYTLIRANLGTMRWPVVAYMVVISLMVSRAVSTLASPLFWTGQAVMVAVGAVLFYLSDVILAANRFWRPWKYDRVSLAFYYAGQLLIALAANAFRAP
jgi:uncharacterized membrane protein YhhN